MEVCGVVPPQKSCAQQGRGAAVQRRLVDPRLLAWSAPGGNYSPAGAMSAVENSAGLPLHGRRSLSAGRGLLVTSSQNWRGFALSAVTVNVFLNLLHMNTALLTGLIQGCGRLEQFHI